MKKEKKEPLKLVLGDEVSWESQAGGCTARKQGMVIAVVPPKGKPADVLPDYAGSKYRTSIDPRSLGNRPEESYVVLVPGKTSRAMSMMYWPLVSKLQVVGGRKG